MVVKTDVCAFSELKIYPGHGIRFIRKDGQTMIFLSSKTKSLYLQKKKPGQLTWTQAWRRMNKKGKTITATRRRTRKTTKFVRATVGLTKEMIEQKRRARPAERVRAREENVKAIKERKRKARAERRAAKKAFKTGKSRGGAVRDTGGRKGR